MNSKKFLIVWTVACALAATLPTQAADAPASQAEASVQAAGFADPLIPQLFAFDKESQIFVGINTVENAVDLIAYDGETMAFLKRFTADRVAGRHDVANIYRPQSVAVYDGHVVVLATQRDSCYLAVLNLQGGEVNRFYFAGNAFAFSYDPEARELYIAGENDLGYDVTVLDAANGLDRMAFHPDLNFHYLKPKKAEEMQKNDPYGVALMLIAISVVFFGLVLLYVAFKFLGKGIMAFNRWRAVKAEQKATGGDRETIKASMPKAQDMSGDVYAAIAAAIYMYQSELHDEENTILTIEKVSRTYSPWSSKLYGMNPYFQIKNGK